MQTNHIDFFVPNLAKNRFWSQNLKNLSADRESAPPRDHMCQFPIQMDNYEFFNLNLGKLPNYVQYFGSNNAEDVGRNWVEAGMS